MYNIFKKFKKTAKAILYRRFYVMLDARANSVTVSRAVYDRMRRMQHDNTDIVVFRATNTGLYCFSLHDEFLLLRDVPCITVPLQYNEQFRTVGFCSESPSVSAICNDYGLPFDRMVRLSVFPRLTALGETFFEIQRPRMSTNNDNI